LDRILVQVFAGEQSLDSNEQLLQRHRNVFLLRQVNTVQAQWEQAVKVNDESRERILRAEILELKAKIKQIKSVTI